MTFANQFTHYSKGHRFCKGMHPHYLRKITQEKMISNHTAPVKAITPIILKVSIDFLSPDMYNIYRLTCFWMVI